MAEEKALMSPEHVERDFYLGLELHKLIELNSMGIRALWIAGRCEIAIGFVRHEGSHRFFSERLIVS